MMGSTLRRRIEQIVAQEDIGHVHVGGNAAPERLRLYVRILRGTHIPVYGVGSADRTEAQEGNQHNQYAEADRKHK